MVLWSWLLLLGVLVYGSGSARAGDRVLVRHRRQTDAWWKKYDPSGFGHPPRVVTSHPWRPVGYAKPLPPALWHPELVPEWGGFYGGQNGGRSQSRHQQQSSPISVQCGEDTMVVTVWRDLYGNGKLIKTSDLSLGSQSCNPGPQSSDTSAVFDVPLQGCGNRLQMTPEWLVYTTQLNYSPKPISGVSITRTNPTVVPIQCYYPSLSSPLYCDAGGKCWVTAAMLHGNVSSNAIKPTWIPFSTTVTSEERLSFSLRLMMDDWSAPRPSSVFQLGDTFSIEAAVDTQNHVPMTVFVDSCVATLTPDINSNPHYEIIAYNGCLMDGKQEDSSSAFISPRPQPDKLQFTVDAFRFIETDVSTIYITCTLKAAAITQAPDSVNKACTFTKTSNRWSPVEGTNAICDCCNTGNCVGQSRRFDSSYGRPRGLGKREIPSDSTEEHGLATLGPLLVVGAERVQASRLSVESAHWELWVLVAVICVSLVVAVGTIVLIVRHVLKRRAHALTVSK